MVQFVIPSVVGIETLDLRADKDWNYKFALFKSDLTHQVYPFFTSDEYRITVSGNFYYQV